MVSPSVKALNAHTHRHTQTHMHSFKKQESCAVAMETQDPPPHSLCLAYPLLSFMTLCNLLIWNQVFVTQFQGCLLEVEESSKRRRTGEERGGSKQVGGDHGRAGAE